ncbi:MAG: hypothetical protein AB2L07_01315 [Thermoanaerobaculaceae bacterium]
MRAPASNEIGRNLPLVLVALAGAVPRLWLAATRGIEYDGWWHIFSAHQDALGNLFWELKIQAHPPLFFLALRAARWLGPSRLAYCLVSIVAGVLLALVLGRITARWAHGRATPWLVALAVACSWSAIEISCEVRAYSLSVLLLAIATGAYLDLARPRLRRLRPSVLVFCVALSLALLTHYSAALFAAAAGTVLMARFALNRAFRLRVMAVARRQPLGLLLPLLMPAAVALALLAGHAQQHIGQMSHLPEYYLASSSTTGPAAFLLRNTAYLVSLAVPHGPSQPGQGMQIVLVLGAALAIAGAMAIPAGMGRPTAHRAAGALLLAQVGIGMALSLATVYPFGGPMRHQFYLFPSAILLVALSIDTLVARAASRRSRGATALAAFVSIAAVFVAGYRSVHRDPREPYQDETRSLAAACPADAAVYLDQFSLIAFFAHHDDWTWRAVSGQPSNWSIDRYELTRGDEHMTVFRDRTWWSIDLDAPRASPALRECLDGVAPRHLVVFGLRQFPDDNDPATLAAPEGIEAARAPLAEAGVAIERLNGDRRVVIVELSLQPSVARAP